MVILIHGTNTKGSYAKLTALKDGFIGEQVFFDAKGKTSVDLKETLASNSLLSENKLVQVENFGLKLLDDLEVREDTTLVLYDQNQLTKAELTSLLKKFPKLQIEEFKLDPVVFKFVEAIYPHNQKILLSLWRDYIKTEEPEIALTMIARQFRLLIAAKENKPGFDEFDTAAPWQKQRLQTQSAKFTVDQLLELQGKLLEIDFKNKTGQALLDLSASLEVFLLAL